MIDLPFFPVGTPQAFYQLLTLSSNKDPNAAAAFAAANPSFGAFGKWARDAPWTESYAQERYNSINSFVFVDAQGKKRAVRWAYLPAVPPAPAGSSPAGAPARLSAGSPIGRPPSSGAKGDGVVPSRGSR